MTAQPHDPSAPITEADRDAAVQRLQDAYAEGHLTREDFDERLHQALVLKTHDELATTLATLPALAPPTTATIGAASGRIKRSGAWRVPRNLKVESAFGSVRLDLSRAIIEDPVVDIELQLGTGQARITVPRNAIVEYDGLQAGWKETRYKPSRHPQAGGPTIRISGAIGFGRLKIRHSRR
ncbi:DUF1707 domain-containing protein [Kribbella sp. NBC_01505]|uniref:DUF1707 SHOCT-like domain-containing protein n=1 Tax=Kribbella sp. NBC_01505 TaxID=2903580 RepID=UPI0038651AC6